MLWCNNPDRTPSISASRQPEIFSSAWFHSTIFHSKSKASIPSGDDLTRADKCSALILMSGSQVLSGGF
jgi:hypothetical protein